jgi:hypothetical protein
MVFTPIIDPATAIPYFNAPVLIRVVAIPLDKEK